MIRNQNLEHLEPISNILVLKIESSIMKTKNFVWSQDMFYHMSYWYN